MRIPSIAVLAPPVALTPPPVGGEQGGALRVLRPAHPALEAVREPSESAMTTSASSLAATIGTTVVSPGVGAGSAHLFGQA
jgi:hypothetical protein